MVTSTKPINQYTPLFSVCSVHEMGRATDTRHHPRGLKPLICEQTQINRGRTSTKNEFLPSGLYGSQSRALIKEVKSKRQMAPFAYQSVQAGASRGGGPLLWAVRPEASVEHIRNTTSGPSHSCGFGLATALKDLQLQKTRAPGRLGFKWLWVQKHAVLLRLCESFAPRYQRDCALRRSEATMLKGDSTQELRPALFMMTVTFLPASGQIPHIIKP